LSIFEQPFVVEDDEGYSAAGDGCVGKVEDGGEEGVAAYEGERLGPGEEGEVEHVDYAALEELAVAAAEGDEPGGAEGCALGEDEAVEEVVDDVACGAGNDEGEAEDESAGVASAYGSREEDDEEEGGGESEEGEEECGDELHAERHPFVFDEMDFEPR